MYIIFYCEKYLGQINLTSLLLFFLPYYSLFFLSFFLVMYCMLLYSFVCFFVFVLCNVVIHSNTDIVWSLISNFNFSWWDLVENVSFDNGGCAQTIGSHATFKFKDGLSWYVSYHVVSYRIVIQFCM